MVVEIETVVDVVTVMVNFMLYTLVRNLVVFDTLDGIHIPFTLKGKSALLYVRAPTTKELENCRRVELTSAEPWVPNNSGWEKIEKKFELTKRT